MALIYAMENKVELLFLSWLRYIRSATFFHGERCRVISGWHGLDGLFGTRRPRFITLLYSNDLPVDGPETLFSSVTTFDDRSEMIALRFAISCCCMATVQ